MKDGQPTTIYALATPPGKSAIAVIRISGPLASSVPGLFGCDLPASGQMTFMKYRNRTGELLDEGMFVWLAGPKSSTGEDVAEIHCHGSSAVISALLDNLAEAEGFRIALPGEFTRRALDNNKMDITAVEGLADLIDSETALQHRQALSQMSGRLRKPVQRWREKLVSNLAYLEAVIDFADEELPDHLSVQIKHDTEALITDLKASLDDKGLGELIRTGFQLAIIGPVNAGKSTALNALAGRPAAIVSDVAGTTRDVVQVRLDIGGIPVVVTDTAGWRDVTDDIIEQEGIKRAVEQAEQASFRVIILDLCQPDWQQQAQMFCEWGSSPALIIANKSDVASQSDMPAQISGHPVLSMCLQNTDDIVRLETHLELHLAEISGSHQDILLTRTRHRDAVAEALSRLEASLGLSLVDEPEIVAEEFRAAATALGYILGHVDVEDLLSHIFSSFCIGK